MCVKIPDTILRQCRMVIEYQHNSTNEWLLTAVAQAKRLKRGSNIDIATCEQCGGPVKVIGRIEVPTVIRKILTYLKGKVASVKMCLVPAMRTRVGTRAAGTASCRLSCSWKDHR